MLTYDALPRFTADLNRLTPEERRRFRQTVAAFVDDLRTGRFRAGLRDLALPLRGCRRGTAPHAHRAQSHVRCRGARLACLVGSDGRSLDGKLAALLAPPANRRRKASNDDRRASAAQTTSSPSRIRPCGSVSGGHEAPGP
ncbi:hypothetical protein ACWEPM_26845 [Streptomyces sp. NPDC004244]